MSEISKKSNESAHDLDCRIRLDELARGGMRLSLSATEAQKADLASRCDLITVHDLRASVRIDPVIQGERYRVSGKLVGEIEQICAISTDPIRDAIAEEFDEFFVVQNGFNKMPDELDVTDEDPEPISDGAIDVGDLLAQILSLSIDPYSRGPQGDAEIEAFLSTEAELREEVEAEKSSPFDVLANLRTGRSDAGSN